VAEATGDQAGGHGRALVYPLAETPAFGEAVEIAPGVLWMRMPLDGALGFINVWALKDGPGWALVDTGMQTERTTGAWRKVLAGPWEVCRSPASWSPICTRTISAWPAG
jgi:hypothetical protein